MIGVRLGVGHHFSGGFDSSASAFFTATGITGATEQQAVNTLVTSLKSAGLWSKMKAVYPFVTDNRNLLSYTQAFDNSAWTKENATITANSTTAPDGTTTADTATLNALNGNFRLASVPLSSNVTHTISIYVKKSASSPANNIRITTNDTVAWSTGVSQKFALTDSWQRITLSSVLINSGTNVRVIFGAVDVNGNADSTCLGSVDVWGAQLELGSTATTYQPIATTQQSYISSQFKYNLVNPVDSDAAFRGVFNGGWTFSNQGALPNGTNGYMDTKLVPSSVLTLNNTSTSVYSRTNSAVGMTDLGANDLASNRILMAIKYSNNFSYIDMYDALNSRIAYNLGTSSSLGLFVANRTNSIIFNYWKNDAKLTTNTNTQLSSLPNKIMYIGANNSTTVQDYSNRQYAFAHIGDGLTDTEATAFYNAVQTFQTTLNRQIAP